jgi:hypothetical protein
MNLSGQIYSRNQDNSGSSRVPKPVLTLWSREKSLVPAATQTLAVKPVALRYIDWANLAVTWSYTIGLQLLGCKKSQWIQITCLVNKPYITVLYTGMDPG